MKCIPLLRTCVSFSVVEDSRVPQIFLEIHVFVSSQKQFVGSQSDKPQQNIYLYFDWSDVMYSEIYLQTKLAVNKKKGIKKKHHLGKNFKNNI